MKERISTVMGRFGRLSAGASRRAVNSHTHKEATVLFHMGGAELVMRVHDRVYRFRQGDMLMLDPWVPNARNTVSNEASLVMSLLIDPQWLAGLTQSGPVKFKDIHASIPPALEALAQTLWSEMFEGPAPRTAELQGRIESLIQAVVRSYTEPVEQATQRKASADARVRQAFEDLRNSAIHGVKIEDLAAGSGMSRSHFFRQFKRCIGVSPQHVIDEERVAYALRALGSPNIMLSQLSEELGFSAPAHFTRFFVQHLGYTPSQFKRNLLIV